MFSSESVNEKSLIKKYDNFVFDLYGTLVDMHTDEESLIFWQKMSALYAVYGADYTAAALRNEYKRLIKEEQLCLIAKTHCRIPEIKLETVFARLLTEAKHTHKTGHAFEKRLDELSYYIANSFRILSRHKMKLYPKVLELLQFLQKSGKGMYLLSNAQAVFTTPEIEQLGLTKYFNDIFLSSDIGVKKPEPFFFETLLKKHSLDPKKTIMVGNDFYADMGIALACRIAGAHINSDKLSAKEKKLQKQELEKSYGKAAFEIYEFKSVKDLLNALEKP